MLTFLIARETIGKVNERWAKCEKICICFHCSIIFLHRNLAWAGFFSDVLVKSWVYDVTNQLATAGIIDGYGDAFNGEKSITRYEMAIFIGKALESKIRPLNKKY